MAEAFIGLSVHVELGNGSSLEGTVSHIDSHTQLLTLKNVKLHNNGRTQQLAIYGVAGTDIKDLQIITSNQVNQSNISQQRQIQPPYNNAINLETAKLPSQTSISTPNNATKYETIQNQLHSSSLLSRSPFTDPAIISYIPQHSSTSPVNSYGLLRTSPLYVPIHNQQTLSGSRTPSKTTQTGSTIDSDSKGDEEELMKTSNGNHHNGGESSGAESGSLTYDQKKSTRRRKNHNTNGHYQSSRTPQSPARRSRRGRRQTHEWAGGDVNDFKSKEFDFQGNLDLFDKEKVFAEIRELDSTAPENLLVNINRNPNFRTNGRNGGSQLNQTTLPKLASHENVLETSSRKAKFYHTDEEDEAANDGEVDSDGSWKKKKKVNGVGDYRKVKIRTLTGVSCPTVQPLQMVEVERIAATETGPNEDQMIENAGRGASMMCLQALGGSRRIQPHNHNAAPLVVILAGNNKTGAYGLATARHLANHGCHVIVCVVGKEKDLLKSVAYQQKILHPTGGRSVKTVSELPQQLTNPVDLIVDALLGYQFNLRDIVDEYEKHSICELIDWANVNKAPVLSLDMPSGVNGNTGNPSNPIHYIHPKWTLCLGAPKSGCKSRAVTGELFLADIGIPRVCWKRIGVKGWGMPWGSEYLIGLEYAT
ncbi:YjeF N-terminal domain-like protein [Gigaspora margarita]|uniref:Enhancer of mRNA-decapping protein 3 n=1 Tax=Gigaspora margarita TaxID=4874 RepID=A0A8H4A9I5_GIGMA|nr:YjeF N-terminal domain-like protein [Gigaspora margarita]